MTPKEHYPAVLSVVETVKPVKNKNKYNLRVDGSIAENHATDDTYLDEIFIKELAQLNETSDANFF